MGRASEPELCVGLGRCGSEGSGPTCCRSFRGTAHGIASGGRVRLLTQRGVDSAAPPPQIKAPPRAPHATHTPAGLITAISDPCRGSQWVLHHCGRSETRATARADAAVLRADPLHELVSTPLRAVEVFKLRFTRVNKFAAPGQGAARCAREAPGGCSRW